MRWAARLQFLIPAILIGLPVAASFGRLIAAPSSLIVDGRQPSVDAALRADARAVGNDLTRLFLPHHLRIGARIAKTGRLPLWDPAGFGGRPFVGNPQAGMFYPPVWLVWWSRWPAALGWLTVAHLLWGGLGVFCLTRSIGLDRFAAGVAAGCFAVSPYVLAQSFEGHYPHVWAASWYPWSFWAVRLWRRGDRRGLVALPPLLALAFVAGHPQEWYYLAVVLSGWLVWDAMRERRATRGLAAEKPALRRLACFGALLVVSVGLVAVEIVPVAQAQTWALRGGGLSAGEASRYHIAPLNVFQVLSPTALGGPAEFFGHENYWETLVSIGWTATVLVAIGIVWSPARAEVRGWAALLGVALWFAAGRRLGLFAVLYETVPGMNRFRAPSRSLFLASLAASVLVGLGLQATRAADLRVVARRYVTVAAGILGLLLVMSAVGWSLGVRHDAASLYGPGAGDGHWNRYRELGRWLRAGSTLVHDPALWAFATASGASLAWGARGPTNRRVAAWMLGGLVLLELAYHGHGLITSAPAERFLGPDRVAAALRGLGRGHEFRIRARDSLYPDLPAVAQGVEKTNLNDYFQIQHAADLYETLYGLIGPRRPKERLDPAVARRWDAVRQAVLDRMNVEFVVNDARVPETRWPLAARAWWGDASLAIYRNGTAMPRAYVVPKAVAAPDDRACVDLFTRFSPREAVVMTADPLGARAPRQRFRPAEYDASDPDRIRVRVTTEAPGLLVIADTWMPGWDATVNGRPAPIVKGNRAQRVVPLFTAGRHEVEMRYRAPGLAAGMTLSAASGLAWLALAVSAARSRSSARPRDGSRFHVVRRRLDRPLTPSRAACGATTRP